MATPTVRVLRQFAVIVVVWILAAAIGLWCSAGLNNIFLMGIVGTVIVVVIWEAGRWRRQEREGVERRRAARGASGDPTRTSPRIRGARRRVTMDAVGSVLVGLGALLIFWLIAARLGTAVGLDHGPFVFVCLLGTIGFFLLRARRHRERIERESVERRQRERPRIHWPRLSRVRRAVGSGRDAVLRRNKPHPARQPMKGVWMVGVGFWVVLGAIMITALILIAGIARRS